MYGAGFPKEAIRRRVGMNGGNNRGGGVNDMLYKKSEWRRGDEDHQRKWQYLDI